MPRDWWEGFRHTSDDIDRAVDAQMEALARDMARMDREMEQEMRRLDQEMDRLDRETERSNGLPNMIVLAPVSPPSPEECAPIPEAPPPAKTLWDHLADGVEEPVAAPPVAPHRAFWARLRKLL